MTTRLPIALAAALALGAPAAAPAAVHNPRSDAAMRKAVRDYARHAVKGATITPSRIEVDCVQARAVGTTRRCSGTFSLTRDGRTARYKLDTTASTFRISPGAMQANLRASAVQRAPGLRNSINWGAILQ